MLSPMPRGYHKFYAVYGWVRINRISLMPMNLMKIYVRNTSLVQSSIIQNIFYFMLVLLRTNIFWDTI